MLVSTTDDEVLAEVTAQPQGRVRLVLPRGRYRVLARESQRAWLAEVTLRPAAAPDVMLESSAFREVAPELAFAKGAEPVPRHEVMADVALSGLGPGVIHGTPEVGLGYFQRLASFTVGPHVSYGSTDGNVYLTPYSLRRWTVNVFGFRRLPLGISELLFGAGAGVASISEQEGSGPTRSGLAPAVSAALGVDLPLARWLAIRFLWTGGVELIRVNGEFTVTPDIRASLGAVVRR